MNQLKIRRILALYDACILAMVDILMLVLYRSAEALTASEVLLHASISAVCIFSARYLGSIYRQIWRYGGVQCYLRLLVADAVACFVTIIVEKLFSLLIAAYPQITFARLLSIASLNLLGALTMRMVYRYAYKRGNEQNVEGRFFRFLLRVLPETA